jgi:hypothetical protein
LLLDDGRILEKEIMKAQLRQMQNDYKENYNMEWRHHYAYLRKVWINPNSEGDPNNPADTIDNLNKMVVLVKNNLQSMTEI